MRCYALAALALVLSGTVTLRAEEPVKGKIAYTRMDGERSRLHVMNADGTGDKELPGQAENVALFPTWSPDGKKIAYMSGPSVSGEEFKVQTVNADGSDIWALATPHKFAGLPAWSPDGKLLAFIGGDAMPEVWVCDLDGANLRKISKEVAARCSRSGHATARAWATAA